MEEGLNPIIPNKHESTAYTEYGKQVLKCLEDVKSYSIKDYDGLYTIKFFEGHYFIYSIKQNKYLANQTFKQYKQQYVTLSKNGTKRQYQVEELYLRAISRQPLSSNID